MRVFHRTVGGLLQKGGWVGGCFAGTWWLISLGFGDGKIGKKRMRSRRSKESFIRRDDHLILWHGI